MIKKVPKSTIEKDFYELVEKPNYLKHTIYGDSVTEDGLVVVRVDGEEIRISLGELWERLSETYAVQEVEDKQYIFFSEGSDSFQIQTVDLAEDQVIFRTPKYLMRHPYEGLVYNNYLTNDLRITTTLNHSFVEVNLRERAFKPKRPDEIQVVPIVGSSRLRVPLKYQLIYGHETKYDYLGAVRNSKQNRRILESIRPWKLCRKNKTPYDGWVYDFEVPETHVFVVNDVLVHNTDSLFIEIPCRPESSIEKVKLVNQTSKEINDLIVGYNRDYLLPRCGFSPDRNETNFKEEIRTNQPSPILR